MDEKQFEESLTLLDQLQSTCTHCGICSEACATFQLTGWEHESPRGRLKLATQFLHGHIHPSSIALSTFDRCLGCRACEPLCPHQVPYQQVRQVVQELRRELKASPACIMEKVEYQRWMTLARRIGNIWWRSYGAKWLNLPSLDCRSSGSFVKKCKYSQPSSAVLAICCVQDLFQHDVIEQTLAFAQKLGYPLAVDRKQPCCGAIFERLVQGGQESICYPEKWRKAAHLQNKARTAFLKWMPPQTYFLSKGCQSFISKQNDSTSDLYSWIETCLDQQQILLELTQPQIIYYQSYCQSQKGEQDSVLRLLRRIRGLTVRDVFLPQACCGGFCGEAFLHSQHAQAIAGQKIALLPIGATLVVTSPDCWSLFKSHAASRQLNICYPIHLLINSELNLIHTNHSH